ncbi:serine hydrolase domain-containing protein [Microbacterium sp. P02]|uniref:serine hydrolase domain-containing protein n=1 Tax=Microbacterium sp. P02 TaxID=3366260 RepID=UPI00366AF818
MTPFVSSPLARTTPEKAGIPSAALSTLIRALEDQGLDPHALVVVRHGRIVLDTAWAPYRTDRAALSYSASKTFTSVAIGFLESEGRLRLDDSVGDLLDLPNPNGLTVFHLLTMNTGHTAEQIEGLRFNPRALLAVPPAFVPGTYFSYNSDATYALSRIVSALTGETLTEYLRPRLLDPLGIGRRWMSPLFGVEQGFSGFHLTAYDIARLASLLADGGRWGEGTQLVPADYAADLEKPWSDSHNPGDGPPAEGAPVDDWTLGYGYQVWRSRHGFRIDGAYGQFGLAIPERGLAIGYQGASRDTPATLNAMWDFVEAIGDGDVETDAAASAALADRADSLDTWNAREVLAIDPAAPVDTMGWALSEEGEGWRLSMPGGDVLPALEVVVGNGTWIETVVERTGEGHPLGRPLPVVGPEVSEGTHLALAARGARTPAGDVLVHLVNTTSPHRMIVTVAADGEISAGWHTAPLWEPTLSTLVTAAFVLDTAD